MDITTIITSVITSSIVSGVIVFSLRTLIKGRIDHYFKTELEKLKTQLNIFTNQEQVISNRRNDAYPHLVELVYKTRNMTREIITYMNFKGRTLLDEFSMKVKELEEALYKYRIDLERDQCFDNIHKYKNSLLNFNMKISEIIFFLEHDAEEKAIIRKKELEEDYKTIDVQHSELIKVLSNKK